MSNIIVEAAGRILVVARSTPLHGKHGGMETATDQLLSGLAARGWAMSLVTTRGGERNELDQKFENVWVVPGTPLGRYSLRWWWRTSRTGPWSSWQPDAILSVSVAGAALSRRHRSVKSLAVSHGTAVGDLQSRLASFRRAPDPAAAVGQLARVALQLFRVPRDIVAYRTFDRVIAVSRTVQRQLIEFPLALRPNTVRVVPNGLSSASSTFDEGTRETVRAELEISAQEQVLLFVGRVDLEKGVRECLLALKQLGSGYHLLIVGDGPAMPMVVDFIRAQGLAARITAVGRVPADAVVRYFSGADVLLMPTHRVEGLPMVVLEAMQTGLPIICSPTANVPAVENWVTTVRPTALNLCRAVKSANKRRNRQSYLPSEFQMEQVVAAYERELP